MNGFHFYAEMPEERKSKSASKAFPHQPWTRKTLQGYADKGINVNVTAVSTEREHRHHGTIDAIGAVYYHPNSDVATTGVSRDYLRKRTVRVPEALARKLHPALFEVLDRAG